MGYTPRRLRPSPGRTQKCLDALAGEEQNDVASEVRFAQIWISVLSGAPQRSWPRTVETSMPVAARMSRPLLPRFSSSLTFTRRSSRRPPRAFASSLWRWQWRRGCHARRAPGRPRGCRSWSGPRQHVEDERHPDAVAANARLAVADGRSTEIRASSSSRDMAASTRRQNGLRVRRSYGSWRRCGGLASS